MAADTLRPARAAVQQAGMGIDAGAWLVDLSDRALFAATGKHRARFLHNFTTCQVKELPAGHSAWGAVTNEHGGVVAQALVDAREESIGIEVAAGLRDEVIAHLLKYRIADRVDFVTRDDLALLSVTGAAAPSVLEELGLPWPELQQRHATRAWRQTDLTIRRDDFRWNTISVDLTVPNEHLEALRAALLEAGAVRATAALMESHRVAHGIPTDRIDVGPDTTPLEVAYLRPTVDWDKGCYLGQEVICMMEDLGKPRKQLVEILLEGGDPASPGTVLTDARGKEVGAITTATMIGTEAYALAMVKRKAAKPGAALATGANRRVTVIGRAGAAGRSTPPP